MRLQSIEQKIFFLILPICLAPPVIFLLLLGFGSHLTFEDTIGTELSRQAQDVAERLDQFLALRASNLRDLVQKAGNDEAQLAAAAQADSGADAIVRVGRTLELRVLGAPAGPEPTIAPLLLK